MVITTYVELQTSTHTLKKDYNIKHSSSWLTDELNLQQYNSPSSNKKTTNNNTHKTIPDNTELKNTYVTTHQKDTPRYLYNSSYKNTSDQDNNHTQAKTNPRYSTSIVENKTNTVENSFLAYSTQKDVIDDEIIPSDDPI